MDDLSEHEKLIEQYLSEDNQEAAVQLLSELIIKLAKNRNFEQAEAMRDRLFEVDSMAVNEIVKTGEIIETEKNNAIDKAHLDTWSEFYAEPGAGGNQCSLLWDADRGRSRPVICFLSRVIFARDFTLLIQAG